MQRTNGVVVAEEQAPMAASGHTEEDPMGFLLFSRTAEAGIIIKLAVGAAFRRSRASEWLGRDGERIMPSQRARASCPPPWG